MTPFYISEIKDTDRKIVLSDGNIMKTEKMNKYNKIVLNIPHSSNEGIMSSSWENKKELIEKSVNKWTDWYTDIIFYPSAELLPFVQPKVFKLSRYIVDVERLIDDPLENDGEGILYTHKDGFHRQLRDDEKQDLMRIYFEHIDSLKKEITPNTLLVDCHSFPSELNEKVGICVGYNNDESYNKETVDFIVEHFRKYGYHVETNSPYTNSLYPKKEFSYHSVMIEINKKVYLNEKNNQLFANWYFIGNVINSLYKNLLNCPMRKEESETT